MYKNCIVAINNIKTNNNNLSTDKKNVTCSHQLTPCIVVGNSQPVYACCDNMPTSPQRVYSQGMRFKDLKEVSD